MSFDIDKTIDYWVESAEYDFETGMNLLESKKFPYALFFAHLAITKNVRKNLQPIKLMRWKRHMNG